MEYSSWSGRILRTVDFLLYVIQVSQHIRHLLVHIPYQSPINVCIDFSIPSNPTNFAIRKDDASNLPSTNPSTTHYLCRTLSRQWLISRTAMGDVHFTLELESHHRTEAHRL